MKNKSVLFIAILSIITLFQNCSREEELILNEDYITVSDLKYYCGCDKYILDRGKIHDIIAKCDSQEVKIKGHLVDFSSSFGSSIPSSDSLCSLLLKDIRNGTSLEVGYDFHNQVITNKIALSNETDMCYIKGIIKVFNSNPSFISIYIILNNEDDIYFENKY